ncbi:hypothetical protein JTB14_025689 [Gonioctena quinquepunctata]|nr:hypothetical protein JTB14_025689 [Gonioctena quinquepunctata]
MTCEEFYTVLTLIESILNSRPLTPFFSDVEDIKASTPAHFLTLEAVGALPVPDYTSVASTMLSRFELIQRISDRFLEAVQAGIPPNPTTTE